MGIWIGLAAGAVFAGLIFYAAWRILYRSD